MSSTGESSIQTLGIGAGHTLFEPKKFDRNEQLLYCVGSIVSEMYSTASREPFDDQYPLSSAEEKLVKQRLIQHVLASNNTKPFVKVDKTRVVVKASDDSPLSLMQGQETQSALVISWNGPGDPPPELRIEDTQDPLLAFKRIYHDKRSTARPGKLQFHWSSVTIVKDNKPQLTQLWRQLSEKSGSTEFVIHCVPVTVEATLFTLPQMLVQARGADPITARASHEVVQALYLNEFDNSEMTIHGHRNFDPDETKLVLGLMHTLGQSRKLSLNANDPPMPIVQYSTTFKLFLPETTVADFLVQHYGSVHNLSLLSTADLEQALRGKSIRYRTSSGHIVKPIEHVSTLTPNSITNRENMHPYWRSKVNPSIRYPDLPCIDVGQGQSVLLPAEMCSFLPGQSYKQTFNPALSHALSNMKVECELDDLTLDQTGIVLSANEESKQERRDKVDITISQAFNKGATVHFAQAGVESIESVHWNVFKKLFKNTRSLKKANNIKFQNDDEIKLRFEPGTDSTAAWRQQLESMKAADFVGEKAVLIVAMRSDRHHSEIYRTIKYLADIEVGIQVYFVKIETLEQKVEKNPHKGVEMAANEVVRRMALRNPAAQPTTVNVVQDIVVSIHIVPVSAELPKIDQGSQPKKSSQPMYLVAFTSKHMEKSIHRGTLTKLVEAKDLIATSLAPLLHDFLKDIERNNNIDKRLQHRVTILRSGSIPSMPKTETYSPESFCPRLLDDFERKDMFTSGTNGLASRNEVINSEVVGFRLASCSLYGLKSTMTYVLLSEDKDFTFSGSLKRSLSKASCPDPTARFFVTDTSMNPDIYTIGAHHQAHENSNASMITLTLLGDPLADPQVVKAPSATYSTGSQPLQSLLPPLPEKDSFNMTRKDSVLSSGGFQFTDKTNDALNSKDQDVLKPLKPSATIGAVWQIPTAQESSTKISNAELERLAKLWVDDSLDMHETKWPVPTHLAHLACKRAQMHVRKADQGGKVSETVSYVLKPLHADVKDTLYYL